MGLKAREVIDKTIPISNIVSKLQSAYADEWLAHYHYLHAAHIVEGLDSPRIAEMLSGRSQDELGHAQRIGQRILELDGELPEWSQIQMLAIHKAFNYPSDPTDLDGFLKEVLSAEREAIESYRSLIELTRDKDSVTRQLAEDLLTDEIGDEDETETLLGRSA